MIVKRGSSNFIVDLVSFVNLLGLVVTGFIMRYILPPGTGARGQEFRGGRGLGEVKYLWSMTRHEWGDIHFYLAVVFAILMCVHIVLHWSWIKGYLKSLFGLLWKKADG